MSEQQTSRLRGDRGRIVPDHESEKSFDTSMGVFVLRRPSLATQMEIHKAAARNLEGLVNVDGVGESLNLMLATISVCARNGKERQGDSPAGWPRGFSWESAYDWDFLSPLYREFMAWVASFRRASGDGDAQEAGAGGSQDAPVSDTPAVQLGADRPALSVAD